MAGQTKFAIEVANWCDKALADADEVLRTATMEIFGRVIDRSPVKSGRFKGNWNASVGAADTSVSDRKDPGGSVTKARVQSSVSSAKSGDEIFLVNALPYARKLEFGSSKQAPLGVIGPVVLEFQQAVNKAAAKLRK